MDEYLIQGSTLTDIADAIREKTGDDALMTPAEMVTAIGTISGGGIEKAEGDFTIASSGDNAPTLTHNLNTQKIAVLIYPTSRIIGSGGYQNFYAFFINVNALLSGQTWTFDWTSYNSNFEDDETVTLPSSNLREGFIHCSPWPTQNDWYVAGNPPVITNGIYSGANRVVLTDNTVRVRGGGGNIKWALGSYHWVVWKLG